MTDYDYPTTWSRFYADAITSISLPYRLTSIGSGAFERCSSLTSVTV
ncbi:MAG: leucine-rich repeat protein [Oscillospiraceae bacterium]|nr:leucine-rich repeat protein [Oscillospiraceae bacterium]